MSYIRNDVGEIVKYVNAAGHEVPASLMSERDVLIDETVRTIHQYGRELMAQIARFRSHSYDDIAATLELLAEKYEYVPRGLKEGGQGNVSLKSFDGLAMVEISVQKYVEYGPELQIAKGLVDEYIAEVSEGVPDEVQVLLNHAFEVDKQGKVNRDALYTLRRLEIQHPKWQQAMKAVKDAQRVQSTREFLRISVRDNPRAGFKSLPINLANAREE